jgi:hypothetical protein
VDSRQYLFDDVWLHYLDEHDQPVTERAQAKKVKFVLERADGKTFTLVPWLDLSPKVFRLTLILSREDRAKFKGEPPRYHWLAEGGEPLEFS